MNQKRPTCKKRLSRFFASSLIIHGLLWLIDGFYGLWKTSFFVRLLCECSEDRHGKTPTGVLAHFGKIVTKRVLHPVQVWLIEQIDRSAVCNGVRRFFFRMLYGSMRIYSNFLLCFGLYSAGVLAISGFVMKHTDVSVYDFVVSFAVVIAALLLRSCEGSAAVNLARSRVMSFLLFDVLGLRREAFEDTDRLETHGGTAILLGSILGVASYLTSPGKLLLGMLIFLAAITVFVLPQAGVVLICLFAPFVTVSTGHSVTLTVAVGYTLICYLWKLIRGKRIFSLSPMDAGMILLTACVMTASTVTVGTTSSKAGWIYLSLFGGYFLCVNLMRSAPWIGRACGALLVSSAVVSAYGIGQFAVSFFSISEGLLFSSVRGIGVGSCFRDNTLLGAYLILILPLALLYALRAEKRHRRGLGYTAFVSDLLCLALTGAVSAWLGLLIGLILLSLFCERRWAVPAAFAVVTSPLWISFLPQRIRLSLTESFADGGYRLLGVSETALKSLRRYFFTGIGIGDDAVSVLIGEGASADTAMAGTVTSRLLLGTGIVGFLLFVFVAIMMMRRCLTSLKQSLADSDNRRYALLGVAVLCGLFGLLIQGLHVYVFADDRIILSACLLCGLGVACARIGRDVPSVDSPTQAVAELPVEVDYRR